MHPKTSSTILLFCLSVTAIAGCQSSQIIDPPIEESDYRAAEPIARTKLQPLRESVTIYQMTQGKLAGQKLSSIVTKTAEHNWRVEMKGLRVIYIEEQDGSLLVKGEDDHGENVATHYDPPIPVFPAKISKSTIAKGKCSMRVVGLNDGLPRDSGTCEYETTLLGMKKIKTPGGTFDAYFIRTVRHMKLRFATAVITVVEAYVPDHGLVSEHVHRKSRILGLIEKTVIEEFALSEHGLPDR